MCAFGGVHKMNLPMDRGWWLIPHSFHHQRWLQGPSTIRGLSGGYALEAPPLC